MTETTCAFTGHRPKSFPWKYNEAAPDCVLLKEVLVAQIKALADRGVTDFLSGMAQGADLWCANIVLGLRKKNPTLIKWTASAQERYHAILAQADEIVYVGQEYSRDCMMERNRYLVDHSAILLAVYNGTWRSGTGATVRYARQLGRSIYILNPISRMIIKEPVEKRNYL